MNFLRTKDEQVIRGIATHPAIWPTIGDDLAPQPADWNPVMHDGVLYLIVSSNDGKIAGMLIFFPSNSITWEVHICLLPDAWGSGDRVLRDGFDWVWKCTQCRRITGTVPVWNAPAICCGLRAGMKPFGVNERSSIKNGQLHHQLLLGISKPERAV